ncbi:hypothetical protein EWM64_g4574 [Hericium alpestre]|uniref:Major facilitator superfamily (MFS) profile domain-containing protein n=1 Tax=Hericium alpestre TaxID=135208 RepID=A0A4Z0A137_9AGAM|nr:hypothetical protein EWM64_g4574 [Hericium alpestre]
MTTEQSPLLGSDIGPPAQCNGIEDASAVLSRDDVYKRFSKTQKRGIVALVSWAGLVPLFVSGSFIPAIPQVAREFNCTGSVANIAISLSIFAVALGTFFWASYSGFYGRRPIYLLSLPILAIGSVGVTFAGTITALLAWRFVQAFGAGSGLSVGAGVIGDIYRLEERGYAMGIFWTVRSAHAHTAAHAISNVVHAGMSARACTCAARGRLATHYGSWRTMQFALFVAATVSWLLMAFFMPETSQPSARGLDKLLESEGLESEPAVCVPGMHIRAVNRLHLTCTIIIYDCLGNTIGAPLAGHISDRIVQRWKVNRGGVWVPEDRLRGTTIAALVFVPMSVLLSGAITQYVHGTLGIVLNLVCLFVNGLGVDLVLSPCAAYFVDIMHARSAETMAADNGLRSAFIALATAAILPLINHIGVFATNAIAAGLAWIGFVLLWVTIDYGDRMRAWIDVGFATSSDN